MKQTKPLKDNPLENKCAFTRRGKMLINVSCVYLHNEGTQVRQGEEAWEFQEGLQYENILC